MELQFIENSNYLEAKVGGIFSLEEANSVFSKMIDRVISLSAEKLLVDCTNLEGSMSSNELFQHNMYAAGVIDKLKEKIKFNFKLAYINTPDFLDPDKMGASIALNRGISFRQFDNRDDALLWLNCGISKEQKAFEIPESTLKRWQETIDLLAALIDVPAALIMRLTKKDIEVFVSSKSEGNPYHPGDKEHFLGSGLYCETVLKTGKKLFIPNALTDEDWKDNPDTKLNMISYLGFPIAAPNGDPFGTICVLDSKENHYSEEAEKLIMQFRKQLEDHLELLYMNQSLGDENRLIIDYLSELRILRGILPTCSMCKKIRKEDGGWEHMESYIHTHTEADFSHTFCPDCLEVWKKEEGIN
ncbi:MAG: GAF domain-containing protein [Planctomycetota bacterium]|jgi:hypothetical protein